MPFGVGGFGSSSNQNFDGKFEKKFQKQTDFSGSKRQKFKSRAFDFEPVDKEFDSETKFYNTGTRFGPVGDEAMIFIRLLRLI